MISDVDQWWIKRYRHRWKIQRTGFPYVYAYSILGKKGKQRLHRLILKAPKGSIVDHIDGNPLNNVRENLRIVTCQENCWNSKKGRDLASSRRFGHIIAIF